MPDVTELQGDHQPGHGPEGPIAELASVLAPPAEADLAEEANAPPKRPTEPGAGPTSEVIKGIVYW